ncbi:MAG: ABC transporter permease [Gammaproteobacteria bacterium]|nr:ABC transporter permease [Gammaproteobacteria bacterium]
MIKPELLLTDLLIYLLVAGIIYFIIYTRRHEHLRRPWRQVMSTRTGAVTLVILLTYVTIGLLDSIHFQLPLENQNNQHETHYSAEVLSVFDIIVTPLRERVEKTYSAPLAAHAYAKETIELPQGGQQRTYPRLLYGGAHLDDPATERITDIVATTLRALAVALLLWSIIIYVTAWWLSHGQQTSAAAMLQRILNNECATPWRAILVCIGVIVAILCLLTALSAKYHVFGTDKVGEDVLYQTLKSVRTGLVIGALTTLIMLPFAILLGIMAGYFRGWIDDVIQYLYTTLNSIPGVLLIAASILMLQVYMANNAEQFETVTDRADMRLLFLCIILGITSWTGLCRILRGETLKLRETDYIQAARAFGVRHLTIITRHILPNVMHIVLIAVVLDFSGLVLAEAVLSYVGVGVDPTMQSWGNMINAARLEMAREPMVWWSLLAAFVMMFILVLSANLFSDAVRDAFDPRLRKMD